MLIKLKNSQVAPFLIVAIAIVIMMVMVTVNLGKLAIFKTDVSNAADSGALSGISVYAEGLNTLSASSEYIHGLYIMTSALPYILVYIVNHPLAMAQYTKAIKDARDIRDNARDAAVSYAFNNAGIDEAKPRKKGEKYDDWLIKRGPFSQWMHDQKYKGGWNVRYPSSGGYWDDRYGTNYVTVNVDKFSPPSPHIFYVVILILLNGYPPVWRPLPFPYGFDGVDNEAGNIKVTVDRFSSQRDFGLWKMNYQVNGKNISSSSLSRTVGSASVSPGSNHLWETAIIETK